MDAPKICLSCGRESPPLSASCLWCGAPFPEFELRVPPPGPDLPGPLPALVVAEVPAPPPFRLARASGLLGILAGAVSALFGLAFLAPAPAEGLGVLALSALGVASGLLAVRKRQWRPALAFGVVGSLAGLVSVVGFLFAIGSVALMAAARDEFLS